MVDKISSPYVPSRDELDIIEAFFTDYKDWDKKNFDGFKSNLTADLRMKQNNKCCYCKSELGYDIKNVDIEHIIPKSKYSQFTFHPQNLALSCPGCNTSKGTQDVLHKAIKLYPRSGRNIMIVHPHFDDYEECIEIHDGAIYEALDDHGKGCDTIKICKLHRMKTVLKKMRQVNTQKSPVKNLVESLRTATVDEQKELIDLLGQLTNNFSGI